MVGWRRELRTAHSGPHDGRDLAEGERVLGADQHAQLGDGARRGEVRPELEGAAEVAEVLLGLAVLAPPPLELVGAPDLPRRVHRSLPLTPAATGAPSPRGGGGARCGVRGRGGDAAVCRRRTRARARARPRARARARARAHVHRGAAAVVQPAGRGAECGGTRVIGVEGEAVQRLGAIGLHLTVRPEEKRRELAMVPRLRVHCAQPGEARKASARQLKAPEQRRSVHGAVAQAARARRARIARRHDATAIGGRRKITVKGL